MTKDEVIIDDLCNAASAACKHFKETDRLIALLRTLDIKGLTITDKQGDYVDISVSLLSAVNRIVKELQDRPK